MTKTRFSQRPSTRIKVTQCKASALVPKKKELVLFKGHHDDVASFVKMVEIWSAVTTAAKPFIRSVISPPFLRYRLVYGLAVNAKQHVSNECTELIQKMQVCSSLLILDAFSK